MTKDIIKTVSKDVSKYLLSLHLFIIFDAMRVSFVCATRYVAYGLTY